MNITIKLEYKERTVTILILIDGFLQYNDYNEFIKCIVLSQSLF